MIKTFLVLLSLAASSFGFNADILWDAPPPTSPPQLVVKFQVYEKVGVTVVKLGEVAGSVFSFRVFNLTPGMHTYYVTAMGLNAAESLPSNDALYTTPVISVNAPANARVVPAP